MNLRDLEYICAVAQHSHFGRAAEACNVSQPTLSGQIKKLESRLGVILFERTNKAVHVTHTGQEIIDIAKEVLSASERIKTVADNAQDPLAGTVSLGLIPTIAPYLIPVCVRPLKRALPNLSMIYHENITERLTDDLLSGNLDAAILATPPEHDVLECIELYQEPFWAVLPKDHALSTSKTVAMSEMNQDDILLLTDGHCFRDQALAVCHKKLQPQALRATSLETLINLVGCGEGTTLVPALTLGGAMAYNSTIKALPLKDKSATRRIYLTYRKRFPRIQALSALANEIKKSLPETVTPL